MSGESNMDHIDVKVIEVENNQEGITSLSGTCKNSVVDCFKNKWMEFYTKQLDDKSVRDYNTFKSTGEKV